jgi:cell division protein FtsQ
LDSKRIRKNRFRKKKGRSGTSRTAGLVAVLKFTAGTGALAALSLGLIFCHDVITQSRYFGAETITVSGNRQLDRTEILARAGVSPGTNILAVNLSAVRKRLVSHPWIAEAYVRRQIPRKIDIRIEEHRAAAVLDLDRRYLINARGIIFKALAEGEGTGLPVIRGLRYSDVRIQPTGRTGEARASVEEDVVAVLKLGTFAAATLPISTVERIQFDREIGLSLKTAGPDPLVIRLGTGDYQRKFEVLETVLGRLGEIQPRPWTGLRHIDLNDPARIVVQPLISSGES